MFNNTDNWAGEVVNFNAKCLSEIESSQIFQSVRQKRQISQYGYILAYTRFDVAIL